MKIIYTSKDIIQEKEDLESIIRNVSDYSSDWKRKIQKKIVLGW